MDDIEDETLTIKWIQFLFDTLLFNHLYKDPLGLKEEKRQPFDVSWLAMTYSFLKNGKKWAVLARMYTTHQLKTSAILLFNIVSETIQRLEARGMEAENVLNALGFEICVMTEEEWKIRSLAVQATMKQLWFCEPDPNYVCLTYTPEAVLSMYRLVLDEEWHLIDKLSSFGKLLINDNP